ncbi:methyltransferase domain-containing protein [Candidatus Poribacteria bacterium]|nr:methyltransferase domain-containing protein [Candidatus Poribacteria bacterium]MBT5535769.1 methyltransferase domain-containing protein [Candidatus Poribacteria bacterium]MBT5714551.1 methyltransferase domain-containing protein [Candidatus Poribacteria bacterium]MBT7100510.1 methyltransferase domain-containing protein [Candidatus Poribacteria bacterium]MBT7806924.1 methyltransferase domain-containing protein [Candidatus Poribacteria bacterium]
MHPGRALGAGCGQGAETLWLTAHGWQVTAADFSTSALAHGRSIAKEVGADTSERAVWIEADLAAWTHTLGVLTSWSACTFTWLGRWMRWGKGWRTESRWAGRFP